MPARPFEAEYLAFADRLRKTGILTDPWRGDRPRFRATPRVLPRTELDCDTPTGEAEAVVLNALVAEGAEGFVDPNTGFEVAYCRMIEHMATGLTGRGAGAPLSIGIVYPTELTEDLSTVALYRTWFEARGWRVTLGSPFNLCAAPDGRVALFDTPCDVIVRHYKADGWGERLPIWDDATDFPDDEPLVEPLRVILAAAAAGRTAVINPFGAVLPENKRAMAFMWEEQSLFSPWAREAIRRLVPETRRLEGYAETVLSEKDGWVLKSDYGREGEEVVLGLNCSQDDWALSVRHAESPHWVAQRYFEARTDTDGESVQYGVFVVAGEAAGIYSRIGAVDGRAVSVATLMGGA